MGEIDPSFGIDDFNRPKMLSKRETYKNNVLTLLFGKPGFFPSIPSIGMDIRQYLYQFEDEINIPGLKGKLAAQCADFLPEIQSGELDIVKTTYQNRTLLIFQLPVIDDTNEFHLTLGVTTNARDQIIYKFIDSKTKQVF